MNALIIGAAGFVGGYLIRELEKSNAKISATKLPGEAEFGKTIASYDLDLRDPSAVRRVLAQAQPDLIFHLAAQSSVRLSWEKPALTTEINAIGAVNLLEGIRSECPQARVLAVGSGEEYGNTATESVSEGETLRPRNVYALTKCFQEMLSEIYCEAYRLNLIMTRSFNHFGPGQAENFVVADFCSQVAHIEKGDRAPVISVGNLDVYRDFTDVRDVVRAYRLIAEVGKPGEVYNVGSGKAVSIREILETILSFSKVNIKVETDPKKFRPAEVKKVCADNRKLCALGWKREYSLEETLSQTLEFYRGRL